MRRGTTPTYRFRLPVEQVNVKRLEITYIQGGKVILEKEKEDCTFEGNTALLKLTQEETFMFKEGSKVQIQVRLLTVDGTVMGSEVGIIEVKESLSAEVLK